VEIDQLRGGLASRLAVGWRSPTKGRRDDSERTGTNGSVNARIVPPLPAASRPSNATMMRSPEALTQSCSDLAACGF
jgi:hypothetical protein